MAETPTLLVDSACICGEGPLWDPASQRLWWVEMAPAMLFAYDPATGTHESWSVPDERVAACVLRAADGLVLLGAAGLYRISAISGQATLAKTIVRSLPTAHEPRTNFNDGKVHPSGAVVLASADPREAEALGGFEHVGPDGARTTIGEPCVIGNGPAFALDGRTMYASDSIGRRVLAVPLTPEGLPDGAPRVFAAMLPEDGLPDGMTVDSEGALWVAFWAGGQVVRFDPSGAVLRRIGLPVRQVTSCAFGGDDLRTLFITSARSGLSDAARLEQPHAGGLFSIRVDVTGRIEPEMSSRLAGALP